MGMPVITPGEGTREQAITDLIESVALLEAALSHILNAEGEKMQEIIGMEDVTREQLLMLNKSAEQMVNAVTRLEVLLQMKLEFAVNAENDEDDEPDVDTGDDTAEIGAVKQQGEPMGGEVSSRWL